MKTIEIPQEYKYLSAFLTMRCNLGCNYCLNSFDSNFKRNGNELTGEEWVKGLNRINSRPDVPVTFSGGEPFAHEDFIYIVNHLRPDLKIEILSNLYPNSEKHRQRLERFLEEVDSERLKKDSPYPSIRVSYHPEQMDPKVLIQSVKRFLDNGFNVGIWSILYPSPEQLRAINKMQFLCRDEGVNFKVKEFTGVRNGEIYGDYSRYPQSVFQEETGSCLCKTSELLIAPNGNIHRCHRDLFAKEFPVGNILDEKFELNNDFRTCEKYGQCHPCDVKVKTDHLGVYGHTSVEIKNVK